MLESVSALLASLKAATPQILIGVAACCGILLFSPQSFLDTLGLNETVSSNRAAIGAGFIGTVCVLVAQFLWWSKAFLLKPIHMFRRYRREVQLMSELTPDEKAYLLPYIAGSKNTQYFRIDDGISQGLADKGIIFQSASVGYMEDGWAYNLQPWARRYLMGHPHVLDGANEPPEPLPGRAASW